MATANRSKAAQADQVLIPAVGYLRCSDDHQTDASIPAQKTAVQKWADDNGYRILRWYIDEGISGWKQDREQFQRLITDLEKRHDFRAVLCWDQNRFSRFPVLETNHYWFLLDRAGVHLATVNQGRLDWNSIAGWLTASIKQHADAQHRFQLSKDVKRGQRAAAEKGLWQGKIPYGYRLGADRRLILGDPAEVAAMQRAFSECVAGRSLRGICERLNAEGIPAPRGKLWGSAALARMLRNPAYVGTYRHRDIEKPNHHPAIVDEVTFARIGRLLESRKTNTTPIRGGGGFLFSKIVFCGKCKTGMAAHRHNGAGHRYICGGFRRHGKAKCDGSNAINQRELLATVVDAIVSWAADPTVVEEFRERARRLIREEIPQADPATIRNQLTTIDAKVSKAKRRLVEVDTDLLPVVQDQLRALLSERERLQAALQAASTPVEAVLCEADQIIEESFRVFLGLRDAISEADPEQVRELIRNTVERIDVWSERNGDDKFHLDHGEITLRQVNNLSHKPGLWGVTPTA